MKARRRKKKRNPGFWAWATEHWFIAGFILLPAAIAAPAAIVSAVRGPRALPPPVQTQQQAFIEATVVPAATFPDLDVRVAQLESAVSKIQTVLQGVSRRPTLIRP